MQQYSPELYPQSKIHLPKMLLAVGRRNADYMRRLLGFCKCVMQIHWDFMQFRSMPRWSDWTLLRLGMGHTLWDFGRLLRSTWHELGAVKMVICLLTCPLILYILSIQFVRLGGWLLTSKPCRENRSFHILAVRRLDMLNTVFQIWLHLF